MAIHFCSLLISFLFSTISKFEFVDSDLYGPQSCDTSSSYTTDFDAITPTRFRQIDRIDRAQQERMEMIREVFAGGDEMDKFFESLAKTSKKFSPAFQVKVKLQMMTLMCKLEEEWIENENIK